jgi:hypothetical protein
MADVMNQVQDLFKLHLELEAKVQKEKERVECENACLCLFLFLFTGAGVCAFSVVRDRMHDDTIRIKELESRVPAPTVQKAPEPPKPAATTTTAMKPRVMTTLVSGDVLHDDDILQSDDGKYELVMQHDGNLVLYRGKQHKPEYSFWQSDTVDSANHRPYSAQFHRDKTGHVREFVITNGRGLVRWTRPFHSDEPEPAALKICGGRLVAISAPQGGGSVVCPQNVAYVQ